MVELTSRPLFRLVMELHPVQDIGTTPMGQRRVAPVAGGRFEGDRISGQVLGHAGSDWLLLRADGTFQQDVRLTLQADDGALILMSYRGVRHASAEVSARLAAGETVPREDYYLRISPFFETAAAQHAWLNAIAAVGMGERFPDGVAYDLFEVL